MHGFLKGFCLCPKDNPFAFSKGWYCCSTSSFMQSISNHEWAENECLNGTFQACPMNFGCESYHVPCSGVRFLTAVDFPQETYNQNYLLNFKFDKDLDTLLPEIVVNNRPVYVGSDEVSCIWWHFESRRWWIGNCINIGKNQGYAYLDQNETCPLSTLDPAAGENVSNIWKSNRQLIDGKTIQVDIEFSSDGTVSNLASSTAGVGFTRQNGVYVNTCTWTFLPRIRKFRCV